VAFASLVTTAASGVFAPSQRQRLRADIERLAGKGYDQCLEHVRPHRSDEIGEPNRRRAVAYVAGCVDTGVPPTEAGFMAVVGAEAAEAAAYLPAMVKACLSDPDFLARYQVWMLMQHAPDLETKVRDLQERQRDQAEILTELQAGREAWEAAMSRLDGYVERGELKPRLHNARPQVAAHFVERPELDDLAGRVDEGRSPVWVTGVKGAGKSQIAAAVAQRCADHGWRVVWWIDAEDPEKAKTQLHGLAEWEGWDAKAHPDEADVRAAGIAWLWTHWNRDLEERRLVVYDNATSARGLQGLLPPGGAATAVLTTSSGREAGPDPVPVGLFSEAEADAHIEAWTGLDDPGGAARVAEDLGRLPLAVAQAAATIKRLRYGYEQYRQLLAGRGPEKALPMDAADDYPHAAWMALWLAVDTALEHCGTWRAAAQAVLDALSLLDPAGVRRDCLAALADEHALAEALAVLGEDSIVWPSEDGTLVSTHRLLRPVLEKLNTAHQREAAARQAAAQVLDAANRIIYAAHQQGVSHEAIQLAETTLADRRRVLGNDHPDTLTSRNNLAFAYKSAGRLTEAIPLYEDTLADSRRVLGDDHPDTLASRNNLAGAYMSAGRLTEAIPLYEETLADLRRVLGDDHPHTLAAKNDLAVALWQEGRRAEAVAMAEAAEADARLCLSPDHEVARTLAETVAGMRAALGR
jgi:tetratricopeptide (TPR) repeat protein